MDPIANQSCEEIYSGQNPAVVFVVKLAAALHSLSVPSHRLESAISMLLDRFGLSGSIFAVPTGLLVAIGEPTDQRTSLIRVEAGDTNLEKLVQLDELTDHVAAGETSAADGVKAIDEIVGSKPRYGKPLVILAFGVSSAAACQFLGGGVREIVASLLIGAVTGVTWYVVSLFRNTSFLFEPTAAALAAALATLAANVFGPISISTVTLASIIALLPGLTLTTAMTELATRNLVAGSVRLVGAVLIFLEIAFGVAVGGQIERLFANPAPHLVATSSPLWLGVTAVLIAPIAFAVRFAARPKDFGWILFGGLCALFSARGGAQWLGPEFGAFIGAFTVRAASYVYSLYKGRPSVVVQIPALLLLVPGSIGYGSVLEFLAKNAVSGVETAFQMTIIAVCLVMGLLFGNALMPPRKAL